jgi:methylglutaconyl-CoA hydratase
MRKSVERTRDENLKDTRNLTQMFRTLNECPKPTIGLVQGAAIGGGVGLVSVCDRVIATSETEFSLSEVRLGIVPSCIGPFVISKIGRFSRSCSLCERATISGAASYGDRLGSPNCV